MSEQHTYDYHEPERPPLGPARNGTFLNGRKVDVAVLRGGDEVRVGPVVLRLRFVGEEGETPEDPALKQLSERKLQVASWSRRA